MFSRADAETGYFGDMTRTVFALDGRSDAQRNHLGNGEDWASTGLEEEVKAGAWMDGRFTRRSRNFSPAGVSD